MNMEITNNPWLTKLILMCLLFFSLISDSFPQIYGVSAKALEPLENILKEISLKNIIYIGENHNNPRHVFIQLKIIEHLYKRNKQIAIGMEIFERKFQNLVDSLVEGIINEKEFLRKTEISNYETYKPIIEYAKKHGIKIIALNADSKIIKKVSQEGFDSLNFSEKRKIPSLDLSDDAYRSWLKKIYELHKQTKIKDFESFYYAQIIRDETMADTIAKFLKYHKDYQIVVISGKGHIIYGYGIPKRVLRRMDKISYATLILQEDEFTPSMGEYIIF